MEELLALARQLRPGRPRRRRLLPALHSPQARDFSDQTGIHALCRSVAPRLTPEQQLVVYRVTKRLSNVAQHSRARKVDVELSFIGRTVLRITDDGQGFVLRRDGGGWTVGHARACRSWGVNYRSGPAWAEEHESS